MALFKGKRPAETTQDTDTQNIEQNTRESAAPIRAAGTESGKETAKGPDKAPRKSTDTGTARDTNKTASEALRKSTDIASDSKSAGKAAASHGADKTSAGKAPRRPRRKAVSNMDAPIDAEIKRARAADKNADEDDIEIYDLEELAARRKAAPEFPDRKDRNQECDWDETDEDAPRKKGVNIHLIIWGMILLLLLASVIIYLVWSRGKDAKVKEGEVTNSYSVEVNDEMVYLSEARLEGHEDDGVTTILCLGNEPFADDMTETGLAGQIRALADNVEVINASFPNSQVTCYERKYDPSEDTRDDVFNLFYVANSINIDDYSAMETVASFHEDDDRYADAIKTLKNTDYGKVDMIAIMYDAIDYRNGASMQNPDDVNDLTTYTNCLKFAFQLIQDKYPWIRIVFLSPYYINDGESDSRTNDIGNGTLVNYWQWACDTCAANSVSFLDNYYGSVNENNYKEYTTDGIHLNEGGRLKIADHFVYTVINKIYTEYDAGNLMVAEQ